MTKNQVNFYKSHILQWKLLNINTNFMSKQSYECPKIKLTLCLFNLKKHNNMDILKAIYFLESIGNQRPFVLKMLKKKKLKSIDLDYKIKFTLSKKNIFFFFLFF